MGACGGCARRGRGLRRTVRAVASRRPRRCWRSRPPQASAGSCWVPAQNDPAITKAPRWWCSALALAALIRVVRLGFRRRRPGRAVVVVGRGTRYRRRQPEPAADDRRRSTAAVRHRQPVGAAGARLGRRGETRGPAAAVGPAQGRPPARPDGTNPDLRARPGRSARRGHRRRRRQEHHPVPGDQRRRRPARTETSASTTSPSTSSSAASPAGSSRSAVCALRAGWRTNLATVRAAR